MKNSFEIRTVFLLSIFISFSGCQPTGETKASSHSGFFENQLDKSENYNANHDHEHANHFHRHSRAFRHLRNQMDKLSLKQKIDRILIENLQKNLRKMEKNLHSKEFRNENKFSNEIWENYPSMNFRDSKPGNSRENTVIDFLTMKRRSRNEIESFSKLSHEFQEDILTSFENRIFEKIDSQIDKVLMEKIKNIRSEVSEMKKCCSRCDSTTHSNSRGESTMSWMLQILPNLQKNVEDLQESTSVVQALHEKQDFNSKLQALSHDVTSLQKSFTTMTSQFESATANADTLSEDVKETSSRIHLTETSLIEVKEQLQEQRTTLDDLLKALPDGFLSKRQNQDQIFDKGSRSEGIEIGRFSNAEQFLDLDQKVEKLELKTSSLDFALMNLQKKVFFETTKNASKELTSENSKSKEIENVPEFDGNLSKNLNEIEFELSKLKDSSESVLNTLSIFEKRDGDSLKIVNQKLSKIEAEIDREKEDRKSKNSETRANFLETEKEIRDDYVELKNDVTFLKNKLITLENRTKYFNKTSNIEKSFSPKSVMKNLLIDNDKLLKSKISEMCLETVKNESTQNNDRISKLEQLYKNIEDITRKNLKYFHKRKRHHHGKNI